MRGPPLFEYVAWMCSRRGLLWERKMRESQLRILPAGQGADTQGDGMAGRNAAVHHWVGGSADQQSGNDVQHGVLLQKDRRNADQDGHNGNGAFSQDGGEFPSVAGGKPDGERADNVDGRADIGVGVVGVNGRDQPNQRVAAEKERRPQILAGGEKKENQQSGGIGENDKAHQTAESRGIPEQSVEHHAAYKGKPDHIGNDEPFAKGDQVVQTAVHGEIVGCGEKLFRICKHQKEDGPEAEQPQVVQTQIAQPECAVGHVVSHEKIPPDHQIRTQIIAKSFQNV